MGDRLRVATLRFEVWINTRGRRTWLVIPGTVVFSVMLVFLLTFGHQTPVVAVAGSLVIAAIAVTIGSAQVATVPREVIDTQTQYFRDRIEQITTGPGSERTPPPRPPLRRLLPLTAFVLSGVLVASALIFVGPEWALSTGWVLLFAVVVTAISWQRRLLRESHQKR